MVDIKSIFGNALGFTFDNNDNDRYQIIMNGDRTSLYNAILNKINSLNETLQHSSLTYMVYYIVGILTKQSMVGYIPDLDCNREVNISIGIKSLVQEGILQYLTQGQVKLIINYFIDFTNENVGIGTTISKILDVLDKHQLFTIMSITNERRNYIILDLHNHSCVLFNIMDIDGEDYNYKHYDFQLDERVDEEIKYLETQYNAQNKRDYFSSSINKLLNADIGIIPQWNDTSMKYQPMANMNLPRPLDQSRFNDLTRDLGLSKENAQLQHVSGLLLVSETQ